MRRRALLASSAASGGGEFTAEFVADYCEADWSGIFSICYIEANELGIECYNQMIAILDKYAVSYPNAYEYVIAPINYGFNVTVEGELVSTLFREGDEIYMSTMSIDSIFVYEDGSMTWEQSHI